MPIIERHWATPTGDRAARFALKAQTVPGLSLKSQRDLYPDDGSTGLTD